MSVWSRLRVGALGAAMVLTWLGVAPSSAYPRPTSWTQVKGFPYEHAVLEGHFVTADARYVVFSTVDALHSTDQDGKADVYLYDLRTKKFELVSRPERPVGGERPATDLPLEFYTYSRASVTPDGRYVVYRRTATAGLESPVVFSAVMVWSRASRRAEVVSFDEKGDPLRTTSGAPTISDDGRRVAMVADVQPSPSSDARYRSVVVVRDRIARKVVYRARGTDGSLPDHHTDFPVVSGDGRFVAFQSAARNLDAAYQSKVPLLCSLLDQNCPPAQAYVAEIRTGRAELASVNAHGTIAKSPVSAVTISRDGRYVAWGAYADGLVPTTNGFRVLVRDRRLKTLEAVSVTSAGELQPNHIPTLSLSPDGRYVVMDAYEYTGRGMVLFVHDRLTGVTESTRRRVNQRTASFAGSSGVVAIVSKEFWHEESNAPVGVGLMLFDRGPSRGVRQLTVSRAGSRMRLSGTVTFGGGALVTVADEADDPTQGNDEMGQDLRGFDVVQRVEDESLLLRWRVDKMPSTLFPGDVPALLDQVGAPSQVRPASMGGDPRVSYQAQFTVNGTPYEVRGARVSATLPDVADLTVEELRALARFDLLRCDELACTKVASLRGGIGTTGDEVRVRLPWSALGVQPGVALKNLQAGVSFNSTGVFLDRTSRPTTATSHKPTVSLRTISTRGTASAWVPATLANGTFTGTVAAAPKLQVRVCLGSSCTVHTRAL